jgi:tRNA G18 (ribose-2'-O)-methylase SpoU
LATVIPIDDPSDPRIAAYRAIRERDLVGREGLFIAEGDVVVRVLLGGASLHTPVSLLVAERRAAGLAGLIGALPASVPAYAASQTIIDGIAGFHLHRGILALGRRTAELTPAALLSGLPAQALVAVLHGIANHDNMGGIFRNAAAFGADALILASDCCDPLYRKAIRVSVGAALIVPFARLDRAEDGLALLGRFGFEPLALTPAGATSLSDVRRTERTAVIFGAEGPGLPDAILSRAQTVRIAMANRLDSLNVATASGIVFHHLRQPA